MTSDQRPADDEAKPRRRVIRLGPRPLLSVKQRPERCPGCGSARIADIVYGLPTAEMHEAVRAGRIVLGGCCIIGSGAQWRCLDCQIDMHRDSLWEGDLDWRSLL